MDMATKTETLTDRVEQAIQDLDLDPIRDLYHDDVVLDVHVPTWRFQAQGPDALLNWYRDTVSHMPNPRTVWTRATPTADGAIVEWELRVGPEGAEEHLCREVDIFHTDGDRITEHVIWCTGMWDPATIARQKAEAPMVRW